MSEPVVERSARRLDPQIALEQVKADFGCKPPTTHTACENVRTLAANCEASGEWTETVRVFEAVLLDRDHAPCVQRAIVEALERSESLATAPVRDRTRALLVRRAEFGDRDAASLLSAIN